MIIFDFRFYYKIKLFWVYLSVVNFFYNIFWMKVWNFWKINILLNVNFIVDWVNDEVSLWYYIDSVILMV